MFAFHTHLPWRERSRTQAIESVLDRLCTMPLSFAFHLCRQPGARLPLDSTGANNTKKTSLDHGWEATEKNVFDTCCVYVCSLSLPVQDNAHRSKGTVRANGGRKPMYANQPCHASTNDHEMKVASMNNRPVSSLTSSPIFSLSVSSGQYWIVCVSRRKHQKRRRRRSITW